MGAWQGGNGVRAGGEGSVVLVRWPHDDEVRQSLQRAGVPRLLVVDPGCSPPLAPDSLEDWVLASADSTEIGFRVAGLEARAGVSTPERPTLEEGDILRYAGRWVAMAPAEVPVVRMLLESFESCVTRAVLGLTGADPTHASALYTQINRIRRRVAPLGLEVVNVRGRGFLLSPAS